MATRVKAKMVERAEAQEPPEPTSAKLEDYTITIKMVDGSNWQGQLVELPGVITFSHGWLALRSALRDALVQYQLSKQSQ